jgi:integrase
VYRLTVTYTSGYSDPGTCDTFEELSKAIDAALAAGARLEETSRYTYGLLLALHIVPAFDNMTLAEITPADIRAFARKLESSKMSASTAAMVLGVLKLIVKTALQDDLIKKDVTVGVSVQRKRKAEKVIATPAQAKAIEDAFHPHYRLMIKVMFATGMRFGEIPGIQAGTSATFRAAGSSSGFAAR